MQENENPEKPKAPESESLAPKTNGPEIQVEDLTIKTKRTRGVSKPFPTMTFSDVLLLAKAVQQEGAGQKVRRLSIFDKLGRAPESGLSRSMITNSQKYGLTSGSYTSEFIELTPEGNLVTGSEKRSIVISESFKLAIERFEPFKALYEKLVNNKLPSQEVMEDIVKENDVPENDKKLCVEIFVSNLEQIGLLKTLSGVRRLVSIDFKMDELSKEEESSPEISIQPLQLVPEPSRKFLEIVDYDRICFFIAPIGEPETEERMHSDMLLESFIQSALEELELKVVRADKITKPGMISGQVIEYALRSKVVVADLSFHNPNVYYELAIRHFSGLPTVHIIRKDDKLPFDISNYRTVTIDTSNKYSLVRNIEKYKNEIRTQVKGALEDKGIAENPILSFAPWLKNVSQQIADSIKNRNK